MIIREQWEALEREWLSPLAVKSAESKGRVKPEPQCEIRTVFQRDRDRIVHCKSFRRLKQKTQVFLAPKGDHYRTRLTHTLEVAQAARTLARALKLNEDLTEAIALSHDLGHTPFGHIGEATLNRLMPDGFRHNEQSLRMVDILERDGNGLNLTYEVRNGILTHSGEQQPVSLEAWCVRRADRIAYINHDIDDAVRGEILKCLRPALRLPADAWQYPRRTHQHDDYRYYQLHFQKTQRDGNVPGDRAGIRKAAGFPVRARILRRLAHGGGVPLRFRPDRPV